MNESTISVIRAGFKIGAGYLIAKGIGSQEAWEAVIGGILALWSVYWGWRARSNPKPPGAIIPILLAFCLFSLGCSVVRVQVNRPDGAAQSVTAYVPAWPWQDSTKSIERLTVSTRTNYGYISLKGLEEAETTSTNAANLVNSVVGAAIKAAVQAAK